MRGTIVLSLLAHLAASQSLTEVIEANDELSTLGVVLALVPDVVETLSGLTGATIFAPNSAALQPLVDAADPDLLEQVPNILLYHVIGSGAIRSTDITDTAQFVATLLEDPAVTNVTGGQVVRVVAENGGVMVNTANVVTADIEFDGGIVHIIDEVLQIPGSVVDALTEAGLTALAEAATAADLVDALLVTPDLTIFAPTNEAFEAIADVTADLTTEELAAILQYHVVAGTVGYSTVLESGAMIETLQGSNVEITVSDAGVMVNDATVTVADVVVANGVVHVIDTVLTIPDGGNGGNGSDPDPTATETDNGTPSPTTVVNNAPSAMPSKFVTLAAGLLTFAMALFRL